MRNTCDITSQTIHEDHNQVYGQKKLHTRGTRENSQTPPQPQPMMQDKGVTCVNFRKTASPQKIF